MLENWRFERGLKKEIKDYRRIDQLYRDQISKARREKKKADEIRSIETSHQSELELAQDEIDWAVSRHLHSLALEYQVPIPPRDKEQYWTESRQLGVSYLSRAGSHSVRTEIEAWKKIKRDRYISYTTLVISLIGATTGVLGATIGVLAFLAG